LQKLNAAGAIDWSAAVVDGSHHHLIVDPSGIPLAATLTGGN
jgi:hypothetical protein